MVEKNSFQNFTLQPYIFFDSFFGLQRHQSAKEFVESITFPPAIHEGFTKADAAVAKNPFEKLRIIDTQVPGIVSINGDSRRMQDLVDNLSALADTHRTPDPL
jgi:hypothetical protein